MTDTKILVCIHREFIAQKEGDGKNGSAARL